jgi:CRP/FNR family transcriptional regulator, cyclic AMP receptor protein
MPIASPDPALVDTAPLSDALRALARRGVLQHKRRGVQLISEGDLGDTLYIVLSGRLRAYSVGSDFREITYGEYGPGECVGEMGLDGGRRSANVDATQPTVVAMVTRQTLLLHLQAQPDFVFELLRMVIHRAREATRSLREIALTAVYFRLKAHLEKLARPQPDGTWLIDPAPSHREFSQVLGCGPAIITKVLKPLKEGGYVQVARRRIVICKPLPMRF